MYKVEKQVLENVVGVLDILSGEKPLVKTQNTLSIIKKAKKLSKLIKDNYLDVKT